MKKTIKLNEAQFNNLIESIIEEQTPHAYMQHWEGKFMKSAEILLDNGFSPENLIQKIKIIIQNKKQI